MLLPCEKESVLRASTDWLSTVLTLCPKGNSLQHQLLVTSIILGACIRWTGASVESRHFGESYWAISHLLLDPKGKHWLGVRSRDWSNYSSPQCSQAGLMVWWACHTSQNLYPSRALQTLGLTTATCHCPFPQKHHRLLEKLRTSFHQFCTWLHSSSSAKYLFGRLVGQW